MDEGLQPPEIASEIATLPAAAGQEYLAYVRVHADQLRPETLVHIVREGYRRADTSLFDPCAEALIGRCDGAGRWSGGRCEAIVVSLASHYGFTSNATMFAEYRQRCNAELWRAIYQGGALWECAFYHCLKQKCIEVARKLSRGRKRDQLNDQLEDREADSQVEAQPFENDVIGTVDAEKVLDAIRILPAKQAQAGLLRWVERRPIVGDETSVSAIMNVSETAVHNLLTKARQKLLANPVIRALLEER